MPEELPHYVSQDTKDLFKEAYDNLPERLQKYSDSAQHELLLNDMNLHERALVSPAIHHGYINSLFKERRDLKKMKEKREETIEAFVERYGKGGQHAFQTRHKAEQSDAIKNYDELIEEQKEIVKYVEEVCKILERMNFSIKNGVDMQKMM